MRPDYRFPPKPIDKPDHISVLLPTRARPEKLKKVFECFQATIENKHLVDVWLYVDDDDDITLEYINSNQWRQYDVVINWLIEKSTKSMGEMINHLWQKCTTNPGIYFPFCDDYIIETPKWDDILRNSVSNYQDGIMLGFLIDPLHAAYQVTIPIPSAQWLNILGYFITNRFYFWFDDMWLDRIAAMVQRKVLIPIRVISLSEKGKTPRIKNLPFWNRYFACTLDDRFDDAMKLLNGIRKKDSSLELAIQNAREEAAIQRHKSDLIELDSERKTELALSDPEYAPGASQLISYFEIELYAVEELMLKAKIAIERTALPDALYILDALELSSYKLPDIDYIKATLFKDSGIFSSATEYLYKHIENNPNDMKSIPLYNMVKDTLKLPDSNTTTVHAYLSDRLGVVDDSFIFFPKKIDEEIYFIIQALIYLAQNNNLQFNSLLVVGAGNGEGAVHAICSSYQDVGSYRLFCIEPNSKEFIELERRYSNFATLYNCSSVTADKYVSEKELILFYKHMPSVMNKYSLESFVKCLKQEKQYLVSTNRSVDCITDIKNAHNVGIFDFVILDGSLFSGEADLDAVYGAKLILLTSVNSIKDYANHKRLSEDDNYVLATCNLKPRSGYSLYQWQDK